MNKVGDQFSIEKRYTDSDQVLADDSIARFFEDIDMDAQREKQKGFLTMAFGGPNEYTGKDLRRAHAPLPKPALSTSPFGFNGAPGCRPAGSAEKCDSGASLRGACTVRPSSRW